ncbi:ABC transporter permease [Bacillus massilinigeriensis]|uniref:ABC transporter permease n=1 Tax=Bacillus massilionigeriensis TaxID=1805475 RepID=UPI00096B5DB6|nr:ABC transporter permease [Bacillus massilionigeriensis]
MRAFAFAGRCTKEIVRDPISVFFGIVFPIVLLMILSAINRNVPEALFNIEHLTPGIAVFSLSFIALFAAQTLAKDRSSSYLIRLLTTPMKASDFIIGYTLPLGIFAVIQSITCFIAAYFLGLELSFNHIFAIIALLITSTIFIGIGLLCGSLFNEKAAVGLCGALLTNLTAFLSGAWFDLSLVGGAFEKVAYALPFVHAVDLVRAIVAEDFSAMFPHLYVVVIYPVVLFSLSIFIFKYKIQQN